MTASRAADGKGASHMSSQDHDDPALDSTAGDSLSFDTSVAHPARIYNYWLGGKDNFAADREAAKHFMQVLPTIQSIARLARRFQVDAVDSVTSEYGVRQ